MRAHVLIVVLGAGATASVSAVDTASAEPAEVVDGQVVTSESRWDATGRLIVTESVIRTADGREVEVIQTGGSIGGVGMRQIPSPPLLRVGDRARVRAVQYKSALPRRITDVVALDRTRAVKVSSQQPGRLPAVQTTNAAGGALHWTSGCIFITPDTDGTAHLAGDAEFEVIAEVIATWNAEVADCSYLQLVLDEPASHEVGFDRVNTIKFRDDLWCRPATDTEPQECYSAQAAGITTLFFVEDETDSRNGQVLDADIEFNAVNFSISRNGTTEDSSPGCLSDLANTLTHEFGHLMGLDHTCHDNVGPRPIDQSGDPIPSCEESGLPPAVTEATMFNFQECGETKKITPEQDDISGICNIYPRAADPGECGRVGDPNARGCCSVAPGGPSPADPLTSLWPLLALGVFVSLRRVRRARA